MMSGRVGSDDMIWGNLHSHARQTGLFLSRSLALDEQVSSLDP